MSVRPAAIGRLRRPRRARWPRARPASLTLYDARGARARWTRARTPPRAATARSRAWRCRAGWCATFLRGDADGPRREGGLMAEPDAGPGGPGAPRSWSWRTAPRSAATAFGAERRDVRRDGLQHRHDRLPGDADRPVLLRPDRRDDRAAHRQHRRSTTRTRSRGGSGSAATWSASRPGSPRAGGRSGSLDDELRAQGITGIAITGTRALTRHLRERGAMRAAIAHRRPRSGRGCSSGSWPARR